MRNVPNDPNCTPKFAAMSFRGNLARVVLTGFMGAGKSTVGRSLAERVGWNFLDVDDHIETSTGVTAKVLSTL